MTAALAVAGLGFAGFAALATAMPRHRRQLGGAVPAARPLHIAAVVAFFTAIALSCQAWNPARGVPLALALATPAALAVALLLTWAPRWLPRLAIAVPLVGLATLLWR